MDQKKFRNKSKENPLKKKQSTNTTKNNTNGNYKYYNIY
jgi:hypothetical protein